MDKTNADVVVGFIFKDNKLLLIKHKRKNMWLPVGGHVEKGETNRQALFREIKEEVNLEVEIAEEPFFILKEANNEVTAHFICLQKSPELAINPAEIIDYKFIEKQELAKLDLDDDVRKLSLDAFEEFEREEHQKNSKIKNLIFVAHPDDELIWFSSILKKPGSCLVICFDNIRYENPQESIEYAKKIGRIIKQYEKFIPVIWFRIPKITEPRIFGSINAEILKLLEENIKNTLKLLNPEKVYAHNPWGEYGHSEHKAVYNILEKTGREIIFPEAVIAEAKDSPEYKENIGHVSFFAEEQVDFEFKEEFTNFYKKEGIWTMKDIYGYPLSKERFSKLNKIKAFLLVSDNNYFDGLLAQINSIYRHFKDFKIYLIHQLSGKNLSIIKPFIYKEEKYEDKFFSHLENNKGHITKINFAKFCPDFIEENTFFYMDTDVIIVKEFSWESPETINCESRMIDLDKEEKYKDSIKLMQRYILDREGVIEKGAKLKIFSDGAFFANKKWLIEVLRPLIIKSSKNMPQAEKHWYGLGFFNAALGILKRPAKEWGIKQFLTMFDNQSKLEDIQLIHFVGKEKPWLKKDVPFYNIWHYYYNGEGIL